VPVGATSDSTSEQKNHEKTWVYQKFHNLRVSVLDYFGWLERVRAYAAALALYSSVSMKGLLNEFAGFEEEVANAGAGKEILESSIPERLISLNRLDVFSFADLIFSLNSNSFHSILITFLLFKHLFYQ
jgi:hypothetical protein